MAKVFGSSIKRREDPSLITGKGKFTDDLTLPNTPTQQWCVVPMLMLESATSIPARPRLWTG